MLVEGDETTNLSERQVSTLKQLTLLRKLEACRRKQTALIKEILDITAIALHADVDPNSVLSVGFRSPTRGEWEKWPDRAKALLPFATGWRKVCANANTYRGNRVVNMVKLEDGTEIALKEPLFLDHLEECHVVGAETL